MKRFIVLLFVLYLSSNAIGQVGFGSTVGIDLYQRYTNPDDGIAYASSGNAILNLMWGPRIWLGGKNISVSLEGQVNIGLTSFAIKDYKGLGAVSFPVIFKINLKGLSGFYTGFSKGVSFGAGLQWSKTELYYLSSDYSDIGVYREFYRTYIAQIDLGYGSFGTSGALYFRYGINPKIKANSLNIGVVFNINRTYIKKNIEYKKDRE